MADKRGSYTQASSLLAPNLAQFANINVPNADRIAFYDTSAKTWTLLQAGANLAISGTMLNVTGVAPIGADYLVGHADATLTNERVVTDTSTITWDLSTAGQAKANVVGTTNKVYQATLTQSSTSAPVATIIDNTLGGVPVFARTSAGIYTMTLASVWTANKTAILSGSGISAHSFAVIQIVRTSTSVITITTLDVNLGAATATDGILNETGILITIGA